MVQNPMRERPRRATAAAAQNDRSSGGGSSNATESESGPGTNLAGGDASDAADVYYSEVATLSRRLPMQQASPCTLLLPTVVLRTRAVPILVHLVFLHQVPTPEQVRTKAAR